MSQKDINSKNQLPFLQFVTAFCSQILCFMNCTIDRELHIFGKVALVIFPVTSSLLKLYHCVLGRKKSFDK